MIRIEHRIRTPLYRNAIFLMANTAVVSALGLPFWMVAARFYTESEVGLGAAIVSVFSLLALLSRLGLEFAFIRFLPKAEKPVEMINSGFTLSGIVALVLGGIFIAGLDLWAPALSFIKGDGVFIVAFLLFTLGSTLSGITDSIFVAKRRAEFALAKNTIFALLRIPLPIVLVLFFRAFGLVSSWGIAMGLALIISVFIFLPKAQNSYHPVPRIDVEAIKNIWRYSIGNYFVSLLAAASTFVLPIIVVNLLGADQSAYFYVAWMIAALLFAIPMSVSRSLFAEGSHLEDELAVNVKKSLRFIFLLLVPAVILMFLIGKWLLLLFGAGYSANALKLLWVLSGSSLFLGVNSVYMTVLRLQGRITELMLIWGFITLSVLLQSYFVAPATGIIGVGYAWATTHCVVAVYVCLSIRSHRLIRSRV